MPLSSICTRALTCENVCYALQNAESERRQVLEDELTKIASRAYEVPSLVRPLSAVSSALRTEIHGVVAAIDDMEPVSKIS